MRSAVQADMRHALQDIRDVKWLIFLFSLFLATVLVVLPTVYEQYTFLQDRFGAIVKIAHPNDVIFRVHLRDNLPYAPAISSMASSIDEMREHMAIWFDQDENVGSFYLDQSNGYPCIVLLGETARSFISKELENSPKSTMVAFYGADLTPPHAIKVNGRSVDFLSPIQNHEHLWDSANAIGLDLSSSYVVAVTDFKTFLNNYFDSNAFTSYQLLTNISERMIIKNAQLEEASSIASVINANTSMYVRPIRQGDSMAYRETGTRYARHFIAHALLLLVLLILGMCAFLVGLIKKNERRYIVFGHLGVSIGHSILQVFFVLFSIVLLSWLVLAVLIIWRLITWQDVNHAISIMISIITLLLPFSYVAWQLSKQRSFGDTRGRS